MLKNTKAFSSFSVNDIQQAKQFYTDTLGIDVADGGMGSLQLKINDGNAIFIYPKPDHTPATFTVLNFRVNNIEEVIAALTQKGVKFLQYEGTLQTDEKGIYHDRDMNMKIAWFEDPAGNILSVLQEG